MELYKIESDVKLPDQKLRSIASRMCFGDSVLVPTKREAITLSGILQDYGHKSKYILEHYDSEHHKSFYRVWKIRDKTKF